MENHDHFFARMCSLESIASHLVAEASEVTSIKANELLHEAIDKISKAVQAERCQRTLDLISIPQQLLQGE